MNTLVQGNTIDHPAVRQHIFSNGNPNTYRFKKFCHYPKNIGHIIAKCRKLRDIVQDLIDHKAISFDDEGKNHRVQQNKDPIHPQNQRLGIGIDPFPQVNNQEQGIIRDKWVELAEPSSI